MAWLVNGDPQLEALLVQVLAASDAAPSPIDAASLTRSVTVELSTAAMSAPIQALVCRPGDL